MTWNKAIELNKTLLALFLVEICVSSGPNENLNKNLCVIHATQARNSDVCSGTIPSWVKCLCGFVAYNSHLLRRTERCRRGFMLNTFPCKSQVLLLWSRRKLCYLFSWSNSRTDIIYMLCLGLEMLAKNSRYWAAAKISSKGPRFNISSEEQRGRFAKHQTYINTNASWKEVSYENQWIQMFQLTLLVHVCGLFVYTATSWKIKYTQTVHIDKDVLSSLSRVTCENCFSFILVPDTCTKKPWRKMLLLYQLGAFFFSLVHAWRKQL